MRDIEALASLDNISIGRSEITPNIVRVVHFSSTICAKSTLQCVT